MSAHLGRRLKRLEALVHEEHRRRFTAAVRGLAQSMSPDHRRAFRDWILGQDLAAMRCASAHPGNRFCLRCIETAEPPALVRAAWVMIFGHVERETPVALPPSIARAYAEHPDAIPGWACSGCGYLMPTRSGVLASVEPCPICNAVVVDRGH